MELGIENENRSEMHWAPKALCAQVLQPEESIGLQKHLEDRNT